MPVKSIKGGDHWKSIPEPGTIREKIIFPYTYVASLPSKKIRSLLAYSFNEWFQVPEENFEIICDVVDKFHNASLIIDDIEDESDLRRGVASAHKVFGVALSFNAAIYAVYEGLQDVLDRLDSSEAFAICANQLLSLHEGQGMELYWRDWNLANLPTEEEYEEVIVKKTTGLFLMMVELLEESSSKCSNRFVEETVGSKVTPDFKKIVHLMGLYFQMRDDYMNLLSEEYQDTKGFCEDLTEGKLSFPVLHVMNHGKLRIRKRLLEILHLRTRDVMLKREALDLMKEAGALEYTKKKLAKLQHQIQDEINKIGGNNELEKLFTEVLAIE